MAADHVQPWVPQQGQAAVRLVVHGRRRRAHDGRHRPGGDLPQLPPASGHDRPGGGHPGDDVPGPLLARAGLRRGAQRARRGRLLAGGRASGSRACSSRSRSSASSSAARTSSTRADYYRMETMRLWTLPETPPPIYVATAGPITAEKTGALCDGIITVGAPEEKIETIFEQLREGRARGGPGPGHDAAHPPAPPVVGADRRGGLRNAMVEWPNGGMKFPKQDIRSPFDFAADGQARPTRGLRGADAHLLRPGGAPRRDPEVPRPRLRPDLPAQRGPQPGRVDRGLRPRGPARAAPGDDARRRPRRRLRRRQAEPRRRAGGRGAGAGARARRHRQHRRRPGAARAPRLSRPRHGPVHAGRPGQRGDRLGRPRRDMVGDRDAGPLRRPDLVPAGRPRPRHAHRAHASPADRGAPDDGGGRASSRRSACGPACCR